MADGSGILRELLVKIGFVTDEKSKQKAEDGIAFVKKGLQSLAAAYGATQIAKFVQHTAEAADELKAQAERIGTTTQALQGLQFAAQLSDASAEALSGGLQFLARSAFAASEGSKETQEAFTKLGVRVKDANGKLRNTDQLLLDVADGLAKVESPTERNALAMKVLGRGAGELVPMLAKGRSAILAYRQELEELGGSFDSEFVDLADDWNDNLTRVKATLTGIGQAMGKGVLPHLQRIVERFLQFWKFAGGIIRSGIEKFFAGLGHTINAVAQIVEAFVYPFITGLASISDWVGNLDSGLLVLAGIVGTVGAAMFGLIAPWALIAAGIALVVEDIYTYFTGGDSITGDVVDSFWNMVRKVLELVDELGTKVVSVFAEAGNRIREFFVSIGQYVSDLFSKLTAPLRALGIVGDAQVTQEFVSNAAGIGGVVAPASSGGSVFAPSTSSNQITIHAAPGMDEEAIGSAVLQKLQAYEDQRNKDAFDVLVPAFGG